MAAAVATKQSVYPGSGVSGPIIAVFSVYGVTAADTVDLSAYFKKVTQANYYPTTGSGTAGASMTVSSNSTVAIPTGPAVDDGYIVAFGAPVGTFS